MHNKLIFIKDETKSKLSLRVNDVKIKVFDKLNNFIFKFPTITSAAKHFCVVRSTISNVLSTGVLFKNFRFQYEVKDVRILKYNSDYKFFKVLDTANKAVV